MKNPAEQKIARSIKKDPNIKEIEKALTKSIGMKVRIKNEEDNKGKITIEYKNPAELNSILELLDRK